MDPYFSLLRSCVILMTHRGVWVINKCIHLEDFFSTCRSKLLHSNLVFGSVPCQRCTCCFFWEAPWVVEGVCVFVCLFVCLFVWLLFVCFFVCLFVCFFVCLFVCFFVFSWDDSTVYNFTGWHLISIEIAVAQITTCQFSKPTLRQEGGSPRQVELRSIGTVFWFPPSASLGHVLPPACCSR